jgi:photosynthetic reaction center H subunit
MEYGAITSYFDVAQLTLWAFWLFFAGLVLYLRREDRREGYPLVFEGRTTQGAWAGEIPAPKTFILPHGAGTQTAPRVEPDQTKVAAVPALPWEGGGSPLIPTGNPLLDGVGPASYCNRADVPDVNYDDEKPKIVPLRAAPDYSIDEETSDPRGYKVIAYDGQIAGTIKDVWVDRAEYMARYLEVQLSGPGSRSVLVPVPLTVLNDRLETVKVDSITAAQFRDVPGLRNPNQVTLREEDRISAYYAGGKLYATPARLGPWL